MTPRRSPLRALAERAGIMSAYVDASRKTRRTSDDTRRALLAAMGYQVPSDRSARAWLAQLDHEARSAMLDPVRVVLVGGRAAGTVRVRLPPGVPHARIELTVCDERGRTRQVTRTVRDAAAVALPAAAGLGYHRVELRGSGARREWSAEQLLIVTPTRCVSPAERLGPRARATGITANLYALRSGQDWGVGDLTTLARLVEWSARHGAGFVGINPLHAVTNRGGDFGPYSPSSRLFRNPVYLDVERVPELAHAPAAAALLNADDVRADIAELRRGALIDYERVMTLKERVLRELHRVFRRRAAAAKDARGRAYAAFVRRSEPHLTQFAVWMAIAAMERTADWRRFSEPLRQPRSPAVLAFAAQHEDELEFHRWLQFEADAQLAAAAKVAGARRMAVGIYQDLAAGCNPGGSDVWNRQQLFGAGAHVGAPPDAFAPQGQNWGLAPLHPGSLPLDRYDYWIRMLRQGFAHSGALRIDHVMGLFRSFWIPEGATGRDGAYVRMPVRDLLGIVALESARHDALVVGEDLGTVPPEVPPALRRWGVLSTRVLYFERDRSGFRPARRYPAAALAAANTHDLATIAGWWAGRDIEYRARHGLLGPGTTAASALRDRARQRAQLLRVLHLGAAGQEDPEFARMLVEAVHRFLRSTPARLVALSLDDLIGELDPVNMPGVEQELYPSWRRRSRLTLEDMIASSLARIPLIAPA